MEAWTSKHARPERARRQGQLTPFGFRSMAALGRHLANAYGAPMVAGSAESAREDWETAERLRRSMHVVIVIVARQSLQKSPSTAEAGVRRHMYNPLTRLDLESGRTA